MGTRQTWFFAYLGDCYTEVLEFSKAIEWLNKAVDTDGTASDFAWRAEAYLNCGRTDEALEDLAEAIELDPNLCVCQDSLLAGRCFDLVWGAGVGSGGSGTIATQTKILVLPQAFLHGHPCTDARTAKKDVKSSSQFRRNFFIPAIEIWN
jgi:tetratricopeptide (TPR) repeat protein